MAHRKWFSLLALSTALVLPPGGSNVAAQTLKILRQADSGYSVEATAPAGNRHSLQASANFQLWIDLVDEVTSRSTYTGNSQNAPLRYFRLVPYTEAPPLRIMLIGDSTASDICGWGQGMYGYFKPNAQVINYAYPWTSTRVFLRSEELQKMILVQPDYVFMQFGYVDANSQDPTQTTDLAQYGANLKTIAETIRGWNGVPILLTMHAPRAWDNQGNVDLSWADRSVVVRQVAAELKTPLIDLHELTMDLYKKWGAAGTKFMESECFPNETMHFSLKGGQVIANLVFNQAPPVLGPYLQGILDPLPKP